MKQGSLVAIGHIVDDVEPHSHLGGGVSYSAIAATRLGNAATIITKCPADHPYIVQLAKYGIKVVRLASEKNTITSFSNVYDNEGKRFQKVLGQQEVITAQEITSLPPELFTDATILIATVIGEVEMEAFPMIANLGTHVAITPQGYFRHIQADGTVLQKEWSGFEKYLHFANLTILSEEDLSTQGVFNSRLLQKIASSTKITVLTKAEKGATIYANSSSIDIQAFALKKDEIKDFTGSGDTFASAFITHFTTHQDLKRAGVAACLYAALKICGFGGIGIHSIPTKLQVDMFIKNNRERVEEFLKANEVNLDHPNLIFK